MESRNVSKALVDSLPGASLLPIGGDFRGSGCEGGLGTSPGGSGGGDTFPLSSVMGGGGGISLEVGGSMGNSGSNSGEGGGDGGMCVGEGGPDD